MKYSEMKDEALEPQVDYDDWRNYRDGFRDRRYLKWKQRDKKKNGKRRRIRKTV